MTDASTEISLCDASLMLRPDLPLGVWAIYFFIGTSLIQLGESILELPCSSSSGHLVPRNAIPVTASHTS